VRNSRRRRDCVRRRRNGQSRRHRGLTRGVRRSTPTDGGLTRIERHATHGGQPAQRACSVMLDGRPGTAEGGGSSRTSVTILLAQKPHAVVWPKGGSVLRQIMPFAEGHPGHQRGAAFRDGTSVIFRYSIDKVVTSDVRRQGDWSSIHQHTVGNAAEEPADLNCDAFAFDVSRRRRMRRRMLTVVRRNDRRRKCSMLTAGR